MRLSGPSFKGEYKFRILSADRVLIRETDWQPNLITNIGLDRIGQAGVLGTYCRIGTGNTAPANADTQLVSQSASTSAVVASSLVNNGATAYETASTLTYEFALGDVVGNMAEIGVGWAITGATLFSRALIVDGVGSPTTLTVLVTEILQAVYRFTVYPNLSDSTGNVTISGTVYSYTARTAYAGNQLSIGPTGAILGSIFGVTAFNNVIGATTAAPTGTSTSLTAGSFGTYTPGNYYIDYTINAGLAAGNLSGGIKSILLGLGGGGLVFNTQIQFGVALPKDNTKVLNMTLRQPWSRHP